MQVCVQNSHDFVTGFGSVVFSFGGKYLHFRMYVTFLHIFVLSLFSTAIYGCLHYIFLIVYTNAFTTATVPNRNNRMPKIRLSQI